MEICRYALHRATNKDFEHGPKLSEEGSQLLTNSSTEDEPFDNRPQVLTLKSKDVGPSITSATDWNPNKMRANGVQDNL
jgi:hypothetical protein